MLWQFVAGTEIGSMLVYNVIFLETEPMKRILFSAFLLLLGHAAAAMPVQVGGLAIDHVWSRSTAAQMPTGVVYLTVENRGKIADKLLSASTAVAAETQIHRTSMDNGVMRMRPVAGGVALPAGKTVKFAPGGLHLMLMGLKAPLKVGEPFRLKLHFAHSGDVDVEVTVRDAPADGGMDMQHMNMN